MTCTSQRLSNVYAKSLDTSQHNSSIFLKSSCPVLRNYGYTFGISPEYILVGFPRLQELCTWLRKNNHCLFCLFCQVSGLVSHRGGERLAWFKKAKKCIPLVAQTKSSPSLFFCMIFFKLLQGDLDCIKDSQLSFRVIMHKPMSLRFQGMCQIPIHRDFKVPRYLSVHLGQYCDTAWKLVHNEPLGSLVSILKPAPTTPLYLNNNAVTFSSVMSNCLNQWPPRINHLSPCVVY
mmetsp:Transcript_36065/g.57767  ORF Transcript_36065/g.57767 Transcript_36065/m.57767 type:complete len:233 (-) Transcript_36065:1545-2243(-)